MTSHEEAQLAQLARLCGAGARLCKDTFEAKRLAMRPIPTLAAIAKAADIHRTTLGKLRDGLHAPLAKTVVAIARTTREWRLQWSHPPPRW